MKAKRRKYNLPKGWSLAKVRRIIAHYENQTDDEAIAEDEAAFRSKRTVMSVPFKLVPTFRRLIAKHGRSARRG